MKAWHWLVIGAIVMSLRNVTGGAGNSENPTSQVERISRAIAVAEGYGVAGAIPTTRNNPGNIRSAAGPIATYATPADGWNALYRQVRLMLAGTSAYYKPSMPLSEIARVYTGESRYMDWANNVARLLGVSTDTPFGEV